MKKKTNKQTNKNVWSVKPVAATLALNHVEVPWLLAVMAQSVFGQFFGYNLRE